MKWFVLFLLLVMSPVACANLICTEHEGVSGECTDLAVQQTTIVQHDY